MNRTVLVAALLALLLTACGAPATPTIDAMQVQAYAQAAAATMVAETRAALPTNTSIPPTPVPTATPQPTPTVPALSTLGVGPSPTVPAVGNTSGDPCKGTLSSSPGGPLTTMKIVNGTKSPVTVSVGLTAATPFGDCGSRSYALGPLDSVYLTDLPFGCYWAYAFINDPKKPTTSQNAGAMCPNNDDKWTLVVQRDVIKFYSP